MAMPFSIKNLVRLVVYEDYDAAAAAAAFGKSTRSILEIQRTQSYRNALRIAEREKSQRDNRNIQSKIDRIDVSDATGAFVDSVPERSIAVNTLTELLYNYRTTTDPPETTFVIRWYDGYQNYLRATQIDESLRPTDLTFEPSAPVGDGEIHTVLISYTFTDTSLNGKRLVELVGIE